VCCAEWDCRAACMLFAVQCVILGRRVFCVLCRVRLYAGVCVA